jgi:hypothetical protein
MATGYPLKSLPRSGKEKDEKEKASLSGEEEISRWEKNSSRTDF